MDELTWCLNYQSFFRNATCMCVTLSITLWFFHRCFIREGMNTWLSKIWPWICTRGRLLFCWDTTEQAKPPPAACSQVHVWGQPSRTSSEKNHWTDVEFLLHPPSLDFSDILIWSIFLFVVCFLPCVWYLVVHVTLYQKKIFGSSIYLKNFILIHNQEACFFSDRTFWYS